MQHFHLSFGMKYAYEPHPVLDKVHPDGVYDVVARDYDAARHLVYAVLGTAWSDLQPAVGPPDPKYWPLGVIGTIVAVHAAIPFDVVEAYDRITEGARKEGIQ